MANTGVSSARQIRNLFIVVGTAVAFAVFGVLLMLYSEDQKGIYLAKNVLLSPENMRALSFNDLHPATGVKTRFAYDLIQFSYYDRIKNQAIQEVVDSASYGKLYELIANESSLQEVTAEIASFFARPSATLTFQVRAEGASKENGIKPFSEIEFVNDYYRISLRGQQGDQQWAYFKKPGILEQILHIFRISWQR